LYLNFLPIPLAYLTEKDGSQNVHIVPEAFQVASAEFPDQISVWQNALPGALKGKLESVRHILFFSFLLYLRPSAAVGRQSFAHQRAASN
jgi:hypothetical protein